MSNFGRVISLPNAVNRGKIHQRTTETLCCICSNFRLFGAALQRKLEFIFFGQMALPYSTPLTKTSSTAIVYTKGSESVLNFGMLDVTPGNKPRYKSPRTAAPYAPDKSPLLVRIQTASLVDLSFMLFADTFWQKCIGKQHERQVDYNERQKSSAGTQGELASGGSRTSRSDVS